MSFLRIFAVPSNAAFCKSSTFAVTPIVFRCLPRLFVTVSNALTTIVPPTSLCFTASLSLFSDLDISQSSPSLFRKFQNH